MQPGLAPHIEQVEARHGRFYVLDTDEYVSQSLKAYGEWTEAEIALLRQLLRPGDNVADIGANLGSHTIPFAKAVGPQGRVFAFEPQLEIFELLSRNLSINELSDAARLHNAACGAEPGTLQLPLVDYGRRANFGGVNVRALERAGRGAGSGPGHAVPIVRLDDVLDIPRLRLIKIDVEGMEREVLLGAESTIARLRPFLYVENETPDESPALLRALLDLDYVLFWHVVPFFDADNYRGKADDIFGGLGCVNVFCAPREIPLEMRGLEKVTDLSVHPRIR